jgi:hypothetical protein
MVPARNSVRTFWAGPPICDDDAAFERRGQLRRQASMPRRNPYFQPPGSQVNPLSLLHECGEHLGNTSDTYMYESHLPEMEGLDDDEDFRDSVLQNGRPVYSSYSHESRLLDLSAHQPPQEQRGMPAARRASGRGSPLPQPSRLAGQLPCQTLHRVPQQSGCAGNAQAQQRGRSAKRQRVSLPLHEQDEPQRIRSIDAEIRQLYEMRRQVIDLECGGTNDPAKSHREGSHVTTPSVCCESQPSPGSQRNVPYDTDAHETDGRRSSKRARASPCRPGQRQQVAQPSASVAADSFVQHNQAHVQTKPSMKPQRRNSSSMSGAQRAASSPREPSLLGSARHPCRKAGVTWDKARGKWMARVRHGDKWYRLGRHTTWEAAALHVDQTREELRQDEKLGATGGFNSGIEGPDLVSDMQHTLA